MVKSEGGGMAGEMGSTDVLADGGVAPWLAALLALLFAWCVHRVVAWRHRWRASRVAKRRARHAVAAEQRALGLLAAAGYVVEEVQPRRWFRILVDGLPEDVELRADLLVRRGAERLVADVKTGNLAPKISHAPTRRQLLEYRVAYDVHGVLLVDMERREIRRIDFPE
jgi:hypothetical protein